MKTLLALLHLFASTGTVIPAALPNNQYKNNIQKATNTITTDWLEPNEDFPHEISYNLPENATDIKLEDFELYIKGSLHQHGYVEAIIKKDIAWFSESEKKDVGKRFKKDKSINFKTKASAVDSSFGWRTSIQFEMPQFGWKITETSSPTVFLSWEPEALIREEDFKMKFSYNIPVNVANVIHFNQQVIAPIHFGSQAGEGLPAQWDADFWLPEEPVLLFRWMDYAPTWDNFADLYPTIRLQSGNSNVNSFAVTQWNQDTSAGEFPVLYTRSIPVDPEEEAFLAHSIATTEHGEQYVRFGIAICVYRENENIYARIEVTTESTFTDADNCAPGATGSVYIGDILLG